MPNPLKRRTYWVLAIVGVCVILGVSIFSLSMHGGTRRILYSLGSILCLRYFSMLYYSSSAAKVKSLETDLNDERNVAIYNRAKARAGEVMGLLLALYTLILSSMEIPPIIYIVNIVLIVIYYATKAVMISYYNKDIE